jgi:hypothetical protein
MKISVTEDNFSSKKPLLYAKMAPKRAESMVVQQKNGDDTLV